MMLNLYLPNLPLDPAAVNNDKSLQLVQDLATLKEMISIHSSAELIHSGNTQNPLLRSLKRRLIESENMLRELPPVIQRPEDSSKFINAFFSEVSYFCDQILSLDQVESLVDALGHRLEHAVQREAIVQGAFTQFFERLRIQHVEMGDLAAPLIAWGSRVRLGLGLLKHASLSCKGDLKVKAFANALCTNSEIIAALRILNLQRDLPPHISPIEWASLRLSSCIQTLRAGNPLRLLREHVLESFQQLFEVWLIEKAKREERKEEAASIYKKNKEVGENETTEEIIRKEFLALFPEFPDIMSLESVEEPPLRAKSKKEMHPYHLFSGILSQQGTDGSSPRWLFRQTIAERWVKKVKDTLEFSLDQSSVLFRLAHIQQYLQSLQTSPLHSKRYNFYEDMNIQGVTEAFDLLHSLHSKLLELVEEWPDQMVLQHLLERCRATLSLDIQSSLAKVLSALENLLIHTDDWEQFANKQNSIKSFQQAIGSIIVKWRQMELSCWAQLLDNQAKTFAETVSDWWYTLYESIIYGSMGTFNDVSDETKFLVELLPLLDTFMMSGPVGQYSARLRLLHDFSLFLSEVLSPQHPQRVRFITRLSLLLRSLFCFYGRFEPSVIHRLSEQRAILDKEMTTLIKLASWKDINVLSLRASAQRTHHQLHKIVRKFRIGLDEPVAAILGIFPKFLSSIIDHLPTTGILKHWNAIPALPTTEQTLPHLIHLDSTLQQFHKLSCGEEKIRIDLPDQRAEDFNLIILSRLAQFREDDKVLEDKPNKSKIKSVLVQKKKALADLLKECKAAGLSDNPSVKLLEQQRDRLWVLERRGGFLFKTQTAEKVDYYFDKLIVTLPKLEASLSSHSPEISTRNLSKLIGFARSAMSLAIEARDR